MIAKLRAFLIPFSTFCIIMIASTIVIAYGRGYRLDVQNNTVKPTGLISATSDPIGAQIYIDNKLKTATNNSFNIDPNWYTVTISKESYISWQKKIRVQGEVVTSVNAYLFPANPSLSPLTTVGIEHPVLSPDGTKIAYTVPLPNDTTDTSALKKAGLWIFELTERPLGRNRDPVQIDDWKSNFPFTNAQIRWSPDSIELLVQSGVTARLYKVRNPNEFLDVSVHTDSILTEWSDREKTKEREKLAAFPQEIIDTASTSAKIISFSPDETKIVYQATAFATIPIAIKPPLIGTNSTKEERTIAPGKFYIYDTKEDKNYFLLDAKELPIPTPTPKSAVKLTTSPTNQSPITNNYSPPPLFWFPTSRHVILMLRGKIDIVEYDRTNWITLYSGPFTDSFVAPWPNGSRIIILTNLNPGQNTLPNLYSVNLR